MKSLVSLILILFWTAHTYCQDGFVSGKPAIAYWKVRGGRETVIVLHGGPSAAHDYLIPEWNALSKSAKVIYYDQRGCGKSEKSDCYGWREHVGDLKRVINQISKGKRVILAGSSWGATLALLYAHSFPEDVKGLILSGTYNWIGKGEAAKECTAYLPETPFSIKPKDTFRYVLMNYAATEKAKKEKYIEAHTMSHTMAVNSMAEAPTLQQLTNISQPVLIFKGKAGCKETPIKEGAEIFKTVLPNAEVFIIPDACHDPWLSHTETFFSKSNSFIKAIK